MEQLIDTQAGRAKRRFGQRITVRLDQSQAKLLAETCQKTGQSPSEVVRASLRSGLVPQAPERSESGSFGVEPEDAQNYVFPPELGDLLPRYRAFGMEIWQERRRCFGALLAIFEAARENSRNAQDRALCAELLRLGKRFGLIR